MARTQYDIIENLFRIKSGDFLRSSELSDSYDYPVFGGNGITGKYKKYNLSGENIIIGRVGAKCGNVFLTNERIWATDNAFYISEYFRDFDLRYLKLMLEFVDLGSTANQAAQPVISFKSIKNIELPVPSLIEQKQIVSKIESLFTRIDQSIGLLKENLLHTQALKSSVLDEELNKVIELNETTFDKLIREIVSGFACNKSNEKPNGYVHLRTHNIDLTGRLNFDLSIKIDPKKVDSSKSQLKRGDVLFNNTNSKELVGKTALVDQDYDYGFSNHLTRIRVDENLISPEYLVNYFLNLHQQGYFLRICKKWIGQAGVNSTMLKETLIRYPSSLKDQELINEKVRTVNARSNELIKEIETKIDNLKALKSSLLDKAFRGEL